MRGIMYIRINTGGERIKHSRPEPLNEHIEPYYEDYVQARINPDSNLAVYSYGYVSSKPEMSAVDRVFENLYLLRYVEAGEGWYNGVPICANRVFLTMPGTKYSIKSNPDNPLKFYWVLFYGKEVHEIVSQLHFDNNTVREFTQVGEIASIIRGIIYNEHEEVDPETFIAGYLRVILSYHQKNPTHPPLGGLSRGEKNVAVAAEYIHSLCGDVKAEAVAGRLNITRKYLNQLFIKYKGRTLQNYIIDTRLEQAASLLAYNWLSIKEIALTAGYKDYAQFSKLFKKHYGIPPLEYRKKHNTNFK